jgi:hypothetical protein
MTVETLDFCHLLPKENGSCIPRVARMHDFRDFGGLRHELELSWFYGRLIPKREKIMHRDRTPGMQDRL